ncbi:MAG: NADH:ubiquinone reductase (Na(+)-transporting) subunit E [Lentisphaerae bacterium]|nr:NADH:ubiquinone reductase (Na(+)-transporting) subunit E [Lentisphaerota bacterium]
MDLLNLAIKSIFIENILLSMFLGMCSYLAQSKKIESATGLGAAVVLVMTLACPVNWLIKHHLLRPGALAWTHIDALANMDLSFLSFICFISVIAALTQVVEMVMDRFFPPLYATLGIFLPLIAVNCAILGAVLFMDERKYDLAQSSVYGCTAGIGWALAIMILAAIRKKMRYSNVPAGLRGLGIAFLVTGFMAIGFLCFSGISLGTN